MSEIINIDLPCSRKCFSVPPTICVDGVSVNLASLDLNLLLLFDALMRTRSVTLAGQKIGLSQSSASNALQRLRDAFNDPLFVRTPNGMEPSAHARELELPIRNALDQLGRALQVGHTFDPATATRAFKLLMSDIAQLVHMPALVSRMRLQAPGLSIENLAMPLRDAKIAMVNGELDLAIGFLPDLGADFHRKSLFSEMWVCVVSGDHTKIGGTFSQSQYLEATHVSYRPAVAIHSILDQLLDAQFAQTGISRKVGLVVPYASGLASTVAASDLVLTAPVGMAASMTKLANVRIVPMPFELPRIDLNMQWHGRVHRDSGNQWIRNILGESYRAKESSVAYLELLMTKERGRK